MSSLLSPFSSFGQRHAYFSIQVTLHELRDVPLVSGRFQAKWRLKHPYSSTTGAASSNLSKLLHHNEHDEGQEDEDEDEDNDDDDEQGRGDDDNSEGNGHKTQYKEESSTSSEHTSSRQSKGGVFSNLFHRNRDHNHHHEEAAAPRPSMSSSRDGSTSNSSPQRPLSTKSSVSSLRAKRSSDGRRSNNASEERPVFDAALGHHQEPRGSTEWYKIQDHGIKWERVIHAGVRIPIEKPRTTSGSHSHSAPSGNSSPVDSPDDRGSGGSDAYKTIRAKPSRDDLASAWGQLGNSELRIMIRQDVVTDAHASSNPHQLGIVTLNLAEHAPCPRTHIAHHHHSHPHQAGGGHHHHHLHLHHHHHSSSSPSLCRTETRRFLLQESKTNATLQLTVTMTHIGGSREYTVPPVRQGLVVGAIAGTPETVERAGGGSEDTDEGGSGGGGEEGSKAPGSIRSGANRSQHQLQNTAAMRKATRIPSKNLKKGADGNAYTPISTAGVPVSLMNAGAVSSKGERSGSKLNGLQFHFTGAGTWERDPDDVVEALFKNTAPSKQPAAARSIKSKVSDSAVAPASTSNKSGSASCRILQRSASSSAKLDAESPAAASSPTASKRRSYFSTSGHKRTPSEGTVKSILASGSSSSHSSPSQSRRSSGAPAGAAALLGPLSSSSTSGPRAPIDGGETVRASGSKSKRLASAGSDVSTGSVQRVQWSQDSAHSPSLQARRTSQPPPSQVATALVPAPGLGPAHLVSESPRSLTPSPSAQNFLSPSASTVMGEEPTPRADDKTPTKAARETKSKDDGGDKETALPAPRPTPGSAPASSPGRDRSDTLRKKKSRGMMGITPEQAESLGYRGRGWPALASSSTAAKAETTQDTTLGSPPGSPDLTTSVPSRPSSPFAFGLELMRSRSPSLRRFPSPYRPFSPPLGDWESKINSSKDESHQTSPPRVISTDYSTKHVDNVDQDEGGSHSNFSSRQVSLQPYVKARLGRPRSRIGLNEEHEKASNETSARMRASSSASGCPAPTVKQGESPWPLPIPTRPGSAGIGAGGEASVQSEQGKREVPALIPGAHSVKQGGGGPGYDAVETTPGDADGTIRASDSQLRRSPSPALGGSVWADAQTELEALRVLNPSPSANSKASSSTAVGRSRSESGPTAVHGGSLKPPPLHTLYAPGTSFNSSSSSLASSNGSGGNRDRGRTRTTSTNSRSSQRSSSRQPPEARSRSRSPSRPQQDGSDKKKAAAAAAAALLDNRPGGVPAPGNYVVRSSAAAA